MRAFLRSVSASAACLRSWCLAASCVFLAAPPARADWFDFGRPIDRGGDIGVYLSRIVASSGQPHVIAGDCMSACTMWLGHQGSCVTPDAVLYFHGADDSLNAESDADPWRETSLLGNAAMLAMYPPRVRAVVEPWLATAEFHMMTGLDLAGLGVPLCEGTG